MTKLEKLSAAYHKISSTEQAFIFGGEKTTGSFCYTNTCDDGESDIRREHYNEDGKMIDSSLISDGSKCD